MLKLGWSLMAASTLHVAVLAGATAFSEGGGLPGPQGKASVAAHAVTGRAASPRSLARASDQADHTWQWRLVSAQAIRPSHALETRPDESVPATVTGSPSAQPADTAGAAGLAGTTGDEYLPRKRLTRAPRALSVIDIPFPPGVPTPGRYKAVLALYIDETGTVRRVKVADAQLPAAYEEAARNAFQTASFVPGEFKGHVVKSLIHIEVTFEEAPLARDMGATSLAQARP